jgi:ATP-binding cassette, subfamily C (CFTR/MRP), member 1
LRAFQAEEHAELEHIQYPDTSQEPYYLLLCLQRWLALVLELLVAAIAVGAMALAFIFRGTSTGGEIDVASNMVLVANATLLKLIVSWTDLEVSLGVIAQLRDLENDVPSEDEKSDGADSFMSLPWPEPGVVELQKVTVSYKWVYPNCSRSFLTTCIALRLLPSTNFLSR